MWRVAPRKVGGGGYVGDYIGVVRENTTAMTASGCPNSVGDWYPDLIQFSYVILVI